MHNEKLVGTCREIDNGSGEAGDWVVELPQIGADDASRSPPPTSTSWTPGNKVVGTGERYTVASTTCMVHRLPSEDPVTENAVLHDRLPEANTFWLNRTTID